MLAPTSDNVIKVNSWADVETNLKRIKEKVALIRPSSKNNAKKKEKRVLLNQTLDRFFTHDKGGKSKNALNSVAKCKSDVAAASLESKGNDDEISSSQPLIRLPSYHIDQQQRCLEIDGDNDEIVSTIEEDDEIPATQPLVSPLVIESSSPVQQSVKSSFIPSSSPVASSPEPEENETLHPTQISFVQPPQQRQSLSSFRLQRYGTSIQQVERKSIQPLHLQKATIDNLGTKRQKKHATDCPCCSELFKHLDPNQIKRVSRHQKYLSKDDNETPQGFWDINFSSSPS